MRFLPTSRSLRRAPRGGAIFDIIALIVTAVLTGGIGIGILAIIDSQSCTVNVFWGCDGNTSGGTRIGGFIGGGTLCVSAPNSCGQSNVGTLKTTFSCPSGYTCTDPEGNNGCINTYTSDKDAPTCYQVDPNQDGSPYVRNSTDKSSQYNTISATPTTACGAPAPTDDQCPKDPPTTNDFNASPSTLGPANNGTTLTWDTTNATSCTITGDDGFSYTTDKGKDSVSTGALTQTTVFTLSCKNGAGTGTSKSIRVIVDPHYKEI